MDKLLYRIAEASAETGIGRTKLYELIASGELPVVRIGRAVRIPARCLQEWIDTKLAKQSGPEGV